MFGIMLAPPGEASKGIDWGRERLALCGVIVDLSRSLSVEVGTAAECVCFGLIVAWDGLSSSSTVASSPGFPDEKFEGRDDEELNVEP